MREVDSGRRFFLKTGALLGGGLLIGFELPEGPKPVQAAAPVFGEIKPNAWVKIARDNSVTLVVAKAEMGQGVYTSMPMLLAEELEIELERVRLEHATPAPVYVDPMLQAMITGGSTSVRSGWEWMRRVGAAARILLIQAAAAKWKVPVTECRAEQGTVIHSASGRKLTYGELSDAAARLPIPKEIPLKDPDTFRLVGRSRARLDLPAKVNGSALFGIDVRLPKMLTATLLQCPAFGGKPATFDPKPALAIKGVRKVVEVAGGVAVIAETFWAAKQGREALKVAWDLGPNAAHDSASILAGLRAACERPGVSARSDGDFEGAIKQAGLALLNADYEIPFAAHACMEPMNCTARVTKKSAELWLGTQAPDFVQRAVAAALKLKPEQVVVHTTLLGGGFGRRFEQDHAVQAALIAQKFDQPVKLIWTREDDIQHDFYRPATFNRLQAALSADGSVVAWRHKIAGPSIMSRALPQFVENGLDSSSVEASDNLPYAIPNLQVEYTLHDTGVPVGFWRSVGNSQNGFIVESFIDEAAHAAKRDPLAFRHALLAKHPRHQGVLQLAADRAGWGKPAAGRFQGIAVVESFGSVVAEVAEVSVEQGAIKVHRVVVAIDCGRVVNPDNIAAQMESSVAYALTAALLGPITIEKGGVAQSNFHDYPLLRLSAMPAVEVHIVPSKEAPGGVGEPAVPPLAPAVANAVFAATGQRLRKLPLLLGSA